jgi:D-aspartate ligase
VGSGSGRAGPFPPAIVLGLSPTGLGVLRSLARLGVEVYGVYSDPAAEIARHSRLLRARYRLMDTKADAEILGLLDTIRRRAGSPDRMVIIPTNDRYARFLSVQRETLDAAFLFRVPPAEIETTFLDKRASVDICLRYGIPIPRSCVPDTIEDVEGAADEFGYPVIIKPAGGGEVEFPGKNVVASSRDELLDFYRLHSDVIPHTIFQEFIRSGDGHILYVSTYSGADGKVLARFSFRKLRQWLPDRGVTSYGVSETYEDLLDLTTSFLDRIGYVGFTGVEYAEDAVTGERYFLELNARAVLPNQLFADAGVDLTAIGYLEMCGAGTPRGLVQRDGVYWINLLHDLPSAVVRRSRGELGAGEWLRDAWRATSFSSWDRHDPKPFIASMARLAAMGMGLSTGKQVRSIRSIPRLVSRR